MSWAVYAFHAAAERIFGFGPFVSSGDAAAVERHVEVHEGWKALVIELEHAAMVEQALVEAAPLGVVDGGLLD